MPTSTALGYNPSPLFDIGTGFNSPDFTGPSVATIKVDSNGKILIVGSFTTFTGSSQNGLIRLNSDGSKDTTFNIGTGFNVSSGTGPSSISIQNDGKILVGGFFTQFSGSSQNMLIRLNSDGSKDTTFDIGSGFDSSALSTSIQSDGKILVGGTFTTFTGSTNNYLIRLNSDGSKDTTFNIGTGFNVGVRLTEIQSDGKILVGGSFTTFTGSTNNRLIRLNSNGSKDTTFNIGTGFNGTVSDILIQTDGKILVSGDFTTFTGSSQNRLIRLNSDGSKDTTFNIGSGFASSNVNSIAIQTDGKILAAGSFTTFTGSSQNGLIRLNSDGSKDTTFNIGTGFNLGIYSSVREVEMDSTQKILVAGSFTQFAGSSQNGLIRLNTDGSKNSSITGTTQVGSFSVVTGSTFGPTSNVSFWMGPDEDLGYVVGAPVSGGTQTTPISGVNAFLGFYRSTSKTEASFLSIVNGTFNQTLGTGGAAKTYLNNNGCWTSWTATTPSSVLIGYYSSTSVFISDCTATFTSTTTNSPLYMEYPYSGFTYSLGQLPNNNYTTGVPFYTDANLTTPLPSLFGPVYAFSPTQGGRPYRKIRIGNTSYDGWASCGTLIPNGYMVESTTKVNVGSSQRDYMPTDDTPSQYPGKTIYRTDAGSFFGNGTTWAWAAQPNVTATHLITFGNSTFIATLS